ncbi:MAG: hypothetical protein HYR71_08185, partial [Chloroflexi bacterium]|nr:hypothetical protein [Chloroflexota bacterium]
MKRTLTVVGAAALGLLVMTASAVFAQGGGDGFPPQTALFNDALLLARALPFIAALGIAFGVWQGRASRRQPKSAPDSPVVIRHDFGTVIAHWLNGLGFIIGMISGGIILRWVQRPDDLRTVFAFHYIGAGAIIFAIASHLTQNAITGGLGLLPRSLRDVTEGIGELIEYSGVFGPAGAAFGLKIPKAIRKPIAEILISFGIAPPKRLGKFLPAEKIFSYLPWLIIITVIVFTGLVKVFRYLYPFPLTFVAQMTALHDLFTALAVIMLVIHLAAVTLAPRNWPLLVSMFSTRVSRKH